MDVRRQIKEELKRHPPQLLAKTSPAYWARMLKNPVFIIGCSRSGKSILGRLLTRHRDVTELSEANNIWDPTGYPWYASRRETPPIWVDPESYTRRWWRDTRSHQQAIRATFGAYQFMRRKRVFLNNTPFHTFRIPYLMEMFPDARLLHIARDGRAVVHAYAPRVCRKIREHSDPYEMLGLDLSDRNVSMQIASYWKACMEEVARQDQALELSQAGRLMELSYEELCADMRGALARVCEYLDLEMTRFSPRVWDIELRNQNHECREMDGGMLDEIVARMEPALHQRGYA